jgi:chaperonin GroEL (HSP60 family)
MSDAENDADNQIPSIEQYAMRAFATALDAIPLALAENSGWPMSNPAKSTRATQDWVSIVLERVKMVSFEARDSVRS